MNEHDLTVPPLDDPAYEPAHRPVNGRPPEVVAKWGAASQVRWFRRFWESGELKPLPAADLTPFYCHSVEHTGACCQSCVSDEEDGYYDMDGCCCRSGQDA